MIQLVVYQIATGQITRGVTCAAGDVVLQAADGEDTLEVNERVDDSTHYVDAGAVVVMPPKPSEHHTFDFATKQWSDPRTLDDLKATRRAYVNTERLKANQTSFTFQGKAIAADPLSRSDIDGINGEVANMGTFPTGWPGAWKCLDNSWVPIATPADWHAFYSAMVLQGTVNFAHAQDLKGQIGAATTPEQVAAVVW